MVSFLLSPQSKIRIRLASSDSASSDSDTASSEDTTSVSEASLIPPRIESVVNEMMKQLNSARQARAQGDVCLW